MGYNGGGGVCNSEKTSVSKSSCCWGGAHYSWGMVDGGVESWGGGVCVVQRGGVS